MDRKRSICFIINPIAGTRSKKDIHTLITRLIDTKQSTYNIEYTKYRGHAYELAVQAVKAGYDIVTGIGGDGTMNELGSALVGTDTALGIIPAGSGNGLARQMGIPLQAHQAIDILNNPKITTIDTGFINDKAFFCTAGLGFDAHIAHVFAQQHIRGFNTYLRTTLREFMNYKPETCLIKANGKIRERRFFLITFANAKQYGNNAFIAPLASNQDGLLDVCVLHPFPKRLGISIGFRLFDQSIHRSRFMETIQTSEISLERSHSGYVHIDGEPVKMGKTIDVRILPASLKIATRSK